MKKSGNELGAALFGPLFDLFHETDVMKFIAKDAGVGTGIDMVVLMPSGPQTVILAPVAHKLSERFQASGSPRSPAEWRKGFLCCRARCGDSS